MTRPIRRTFLKQAALIALSPTIPQFLCHSVNGSEATNDKILVVIQLDGGNDGINTFVPYNDEGYTKYRDKLRIPTDKLIKINNAVGFHPSLRLAADLLEDGRLAIVQGVGYPNPSRSHGLSNSIWQTARFDPSEHTSFGWLGRATDERARETDRTPHSVLLGDDAMPIALRGRRSVAISLANLNDLKLSNARILSSAKTSQEATEATSIVRTDSSQSNDLLSFTRRASLDAYTTSDLIDELKSKHAEDASKYPSTILSNRLQSIATLVKSGFTTQVYYAIQSGYDTHAAQLPTHARLLAELAGGLKAFHNDLKSSGLEDRVITLCFSEFGRRVQEDSSLGTDHGTAGPVFLAGSSVQPGLIGEPPSLTDLDDGDLKVQFDFRRIYASLLKNWLNVAPEKSLIGEFERMPLIALS